MSARARVRTNGSATRVVGRLNVYRRALASLCGPGLFGNKARLRQDLDHRLGRGREQVPPVREARSPCVTAAVCCGCA